ncbi:MAG TPA: Abi family protein [Nitrospirae bacterium]|nr:Abi-like protein [bacterium BMS3Abin06]HDH13374.1 Abi family protein [Nitrospirota bacterium]HDZ00742.1 Abi family protein [Nitrospirota bacterium]
MKYTKPPLAIDEQINLLISRGISIPDRARAARYLSHINYYRLRAYWLPFEESTGNEDHIFKADTKFEDALTLYIFDRKFRLLVLEAIERIEVSFRTRFAYVLGNKYGSHAYLNPDHFKSPDKYQQCITSLQEELNRSRETFIEHYKSKYSEPELPPIWAVCEVMSFGQLSKWYQNLKYHADRKAIADVYKIDERVLGSFMHHLTHVRNLVAHHSRLWNRRLTFTMRIPRSPAVISESFNPHKERKIYNTLAMLCYLLALMSPGTTWPARLKGLIIETGLVDPSVMGFPDKWHELSIWKGNA